MSLSLRFRFPPAMGNFLPILRLRLAWESGFTYICTLRKLCHLLQVKFIACRQTIIALLFQTSMKAHGHKTGHTRRILRTSFEEHGNVHTRPATLNWAPMGTGSCVFRR